jgi:hypothetical protein
MILVGKSLSVAARSLAGDRVLAPFQSVACGVGHNEDPFAYMGGTDEGSGYGVPFRVIPHGGQVSEYISHSPSKETWDVLHEDEAGS